MDDAWNVNFCYGINRILAEMRRRRRRDSAYKNLKSYIENYEIIDYTQQESIKFIRSRTWNRSSCINALIQFDNSNYNRKIAGEFKLGISNLRISKKGWFYLYEPVLNKITQFVEDLFENAADLNCKKVIVVSGFANSEYVMARLMSILPDKLFFKPSQPHLCVVRGLLYWICQRRKLGIDCPVFKLETRMRYSYGIGIDRKFRDGCDPEVRRKMVPGLGATVRNAFGALLIRNQEYKEGYTEIFNYWIPARAKQLDITLYASEDPFCQYVFDEDGLLPIIDGSKCFEVKKYVIPINKVCEEKQRFELKIEYHQTGINFYYVDPSDKLERRGIFVTDDEYKQNGIGTKSYQMSKGCKLIAVEEDIRTKAVVAVDIGNYGTSMGYIICNEEREQQILIEKDWCQNGDGRSKIKTDILLSKHGKYVAFGDNVVEQLKDLSPFILTNILEYSEFVDANVDDDSDSDGSDDDEKGSGYMLFERFKQGLYHEKCIRIESDNKHEYVYEKDLLERIKAQNPTKYISASTIFIETFKYLKKIAITTLRKNGVKSIGTNDIQWVITTPSNWNTRAKFKLVKWALSARLINKNIFDHLRFVSEAECASISCQYTDINGEQGPFKFGERYLQIDAGGMLFDKNTKFANF